MNQGSRPDSARAGALSRPLFLECDKSGQVIWMSESSGDWLGRGSGLIDALAGGGLRFLCDGASPLCDGISLHLTRLGGLREHTLISAEAEPVRYGDGRYSGLIGVQSRMLRNVARLRGAEERLARLARRPSIGSKLLEQIELERQRVARDLHAGVGQALAAIRLQLDIINRQIGTPRAEVRTALDSIVTLAVQALEQVRGISHRLHPPEWQSLELSEAIRGLWHISGIEQRFMARLDISGLRTEPSHAVKVLLYRVVQEALSNVIRHSGASRVDLTAAVTEGRVSLTVADNGHGFDPAAPGEEQGRLTAGLGLRSIREQVAALGGEFAIDSGEYGTTLAVTLPVREPDEA